MQNPSDFEVHHRPSHCTASRLKVPPFSGNFSRHLSILVQPPPHIRCFAAALFSSRLCAAEPPGGAGGVRLSLKRQQKAQVASLSRRLKSIPPLKLPPSRFSLPPAAPATRRRPPPTLAVLAAWNLWEGRRGGAAKWGVPQCVHARWMRLVDGRGGGRGGRRGRRDGAAGWGGGRTGGVRGWLGRASPAK